MVIRLMTQRPSGLQNLTSESISSHPHDHVTCILFVQNSVQYSFVVNADNIVSFICRTVFKHLVPTVKRHPAIVSSNIAVHRPSVLGSWELSRVYYLLRSLTCSSFAMESNISITRLIAIGHIHSSFLFLSDSYDS